MEIKKRAAIIAAVFFLSCRALCAQQAGYYVDYSEGDPKLIQRLVWDKDEYVLYYEVSILVNDFGWYREFLKDTTEDNFLPVSLPPGKYRYSVTPYDLLGIRGETSEWKEFEIMHAFQPVINSFAPDLFYLDKNQERVLYLSAENILEESEIYLQGATGFIRPKKITINSKETTLVFEDLELIPGNYDIYVRNPGGLYTRKGEFVIRYQKPTDFFLKLAWNPAIPIYGYMDEIIGGNIFPLGVSLSFQTVSSSRGLFNAGLELAASVFFLSPAIPILPDSDFPTGEISFTSFDFNFTLQRRFNRNRMVFTFRFGFGVVILNSFELFQDSGIIIQVNLGVDFLVRLFGNFYLEAGLDFNNLFSPASSGIIKPRLGVSLQF